MNKGHIVTAVIRGRARKAFSIFMTAMLTLSMVPSTQAVAEVLQSQETEPAVEVHAPEGAFSAGTTASMVSAGAQDVIDAASDAAEGTSAAARAVDISFIKDGEELESAGGTSVQVEVISDTGLLGWCAYSGNAVTQTYNHGENIAKDSLTLYPNLKKGKRIVLDTGIEEDGAPVAAVEKVRGKQVTGGHEIDMAQVAAVSASDGLRPGWNFDGWYTETTNNTNVTVKRTFVLITTLKPL